MKFAVLALMLVAKLLTVEEMFVRFYVIAVMFEVLAVMFVVLAVMFDVLFEMFEVFKLTVVERFVRFEERFVMFVLTFVERFVMLAVFAAMLEEKESMVNEYAEISAAFDLIRVDNTVMTPCPRKLYCILSYSISA